jgi:hypothetical protein
LGRVSPRSSNRPQIWFTTAVRRLTQQLAHAVQRLQIQLLLRLDRNKTH